MPAPSTAMRFGTAGSGKRSAPPRRLALEAIFCPISGPFYWRVICWTWAKRSAHGRRPLSEACGARKRARVARIAAGSPVAGGRRPPRRSPALFGASIVAFVALPPCLACMERAGPRPKAIPARAQRSASPYQGNIHATATTRAAREGAMAWSKVAGLAGRLRCRRRAPWWSRRPTYRVRACRARP